MVDLTAAQLMLHQMVREFSEKEIRPNDMAIDQQRFFVNGIYQKLIDNGFLGLMLPEQYGGAGFDAIATAQTIYDLAVGNASVAVTLEGHYKTLDQLLKYGQPSLLERYLPSANQRIFAFSMTEPSGGSDHSTLGSTAVRQGENWVLNGNKIMITNGGLAEVYCVLVKTAPEEFSVFLIDQNMPGFKFGKRENFLGLTGTPIAEIFMENIVVPADHLLGKVGQGHEIGDSAHADARILMGAVAAGIIEHELEIAVAYAYQRKSGQFRLTELQAIQRKLADIALAKETTTLLYQEAAALKQQRRPYAEVAAMAKTHGSRQAVRAGDDALQILAGYGYSLDYPVEHLIRDARALEIAEGTVEKMRGEITKLEVATRI
ncbi:acyl-CoA dehydrogenase family protein [Lapidilactobacillus luobeiensis]|uniref:acyl-CoA dehydrogenase family protein n=1 Tax=Lapidilactobacillus luobeiensis TaxID=2950371 RepID=UPI0021C40C37|nr:acyl-CoA dehydrogenase family protein [Lapidilactobacillus luobeiensis]